MLTWTHSAGGPLALAALDLIKLWEGVGAGTGESDYNRACAVKGYLGPLRLHGGEYLILGDEPLMSALLLSETGLTVVRWNYCDSHELAADVLMSLPGSLPAFEPAVGFEVPTPGLGLFDAADSGIAVAGKTPEARLAAGRYLVSTEKYEKANQYSFRIHRFKPET